MESEELELMVADLETADAYSFLHRDLKAAWQSAVLAYNAAQNSGLTDTATVIAESIVTLSQSLNHCEMMMQPTQGETDIED